MYGLINRAVRDLTAQAFGTAVWERVAVRAGVADIDFAAMDQYPDSVTYDLVGAICAETGLTADQALEAFGEFWIKYTGAEGYGAVLSASGDTLPEFLGNLDELHARVSLSFRDLQPPSFTVEDETDRSLRLHYRSHRMGLGPLMVGLLKGLGDRFLVDVDVTREIMPTPPDQGVHEVYSVSWRPRSGAPAPEGTGTAAQPQAR